VAQDRQQALFSQHGQLYPRGTVVVRQGDRGGHLYLIVRGELDVSVRREKEDAIIRRAGPGQFLGVTSCFTGLPHTVTLTAASNAFVLRLPPSAVDELIHVNPNFAIAVIEELVDRLRGATERSVGVVSAPRVAAPAAIVDEAVSEGETVPADEPAKEAEAPG
jgi:CRP-like cAMP-binding protein